MTLPSHFNSANYFRDMYILLIIFPLDIERQCTEAWDVICQGYAWLCQILEGLIINFFSLSNENHRTVILLADLQAEYKTMFYEE